jgi:hypothetical protein
MLVHVDDREQNGDAVNAGKMVKAECKTCQFMCSAQDFLQAYRKPRNPGGRGGGKACARHFFRLAASPFCRQGGNFKAARKTLSSI